MRTFCISFKESGNMNDFIKLILCLIVSFLFSFLFCKIHLKFFKSTPKDQEEVKALHPHHQFKSCGGIDFILSTLITFILFNFKNSNHKSFFLLIFTALYFALIGWIDDLIKIKAKDNKGLSALLRIILELIGAIIIVEITSIELIEFIRVKEIYIYIGSFALIYAVFCILGTCNAINLTDGLDGLVTITYLLAVTPFVYISIRQGNFIVCSFLISLIGSLLAYLCFNFNPSKLIMGDVGSLSLGALLAVSAIILNSEILLLISGGIYIIEALSVILQVSYFKLTKGKRIFKMTPLHYHFIKKGMKDTNVVLLFTVFGIILSILATIIGVII